MQIMQNLHNPYNHTQINNITVHYGNGAKNKLLEENKKFNFKFYYKLPDKKIKYCSVGFDSIKEFIKFIKPFGGKYYIYEYLFSHNKCKPYFDYEFDCDPKNIISDKDLAKQLDKLKQDIIDCFKNMHKIDISKKNLVFMCSSGIKGDKYKISYHIIINSGHVYESNVQNIYIAQDLKNKHPEIDLSVYSKDRMMRTLLSAKNWDDARTFVLVDDKYKPVNITMSKIEPYLISTITEDHTILNLNTSNQAILNKYCKKITRSKENQLQNSELSQETKNIIERIQHHIRKRYIEDCSYTGFSYSNKYVHYHQFNYTDRSIKCYNGKQHDNIGFSAHLDDQNNINIKCLSASCKNTSYILCNLYVNDAYDDFEKINSQYLTNNDLVMSSLEKLSDDELRILIIKSIMGSGKTEAMIKYIDSYKPKRVLVISTRQTYSNNIYGKLGKYGFTNYLVDKNTFQYQDRIIVQLESLTKLLSNKNLEDFDLIILDEVCAILFHFCSETIMSRSRETFGLLEFLCKSKKSKILILDADYNEQCHVFVNALGKKYMGIYNEFKQQERQISLTTNIKYFMEEINESIENNENICIIGLSTKKLHDIADSFDNKNLKYLLHTRDSDDSLKSSLVNINELWKKEQIVMFSPTISVGVDFNINHFDKIYSIIVAGSCDPRLYVQMLGRIRKIKSNNIISYYEKNMSSSTNEILYTYDDLYDYFRYISTDDFITKVLTTAEGKITTCNKIELYEKIMIYNKITELNKSSELFMTQLNTLCMQSNYKLYFREDKKSKGYSSVFNEEVYKNKIIEADDVDNEEYLKICDRINSNKASEDDKMAFHKYNFKHTWNLENVTMNDLNNYYGKENKLFNLKYLLNMHHKNMKISDEIVKKRKVIKEIINVLGFDIKDTKIKIDKQEFYENVKKLFENSGFIKNYNNNRLLFGKPKHVLNKKVSGANLINILNSFFEDFGLRIDIIENKQIRKNNKKMYIFSAQLKIFEIYQNIIKK